MNVCKKNINIKKGLYNYLKHFKVLNQQNKKHFDCYLFDK